MKTTNRKLETGAAAASGAGHKSHLQYIAFTLQILSTVLSSILQPVMRGDDTHEVTELGLADFGSIFFEPATATLPVQQSRLLIL
jgi:hypothetical protein